jgi:uncharacterized protein YycO
MKKKTAFIAIFIVAVVLVVVLYANSLTSAQPTQTGDMRQNLTQELPEVSVLTADWESWSKIFQEGGGVVSRVDSWDVFKNYCESYTFTVMIDEDACVVWFKGSFTQAIYYKY